MSFEWTLKERLSLDTLPSNTKGRPSISTWAFGILNDPN